MCVRIQMGTAIRAKSIVKLTVTNVHDHDVDWCSSVCCGLGTPEVGRLLGDAAVFVDLAICTTQILFELTLT